MKTIHKINIAAVFLMAGLVIGLTISSDLGVQSLGHAGAPEVPAESVRTLEQLSNAMVDVVEAVMPSVVNIATTKTVTTQGMGNMFNDPFFRRFFGDQLPQQYGQPHKEELSSLGSGVIVDSSGYILTNNHVIKDADEITVRLSDSKEYKGKVIGTDPKTDIAVVKIDADGLPAVKWGDSDKLRVGELVIAVGSPYGLNKTVTSGIVSAKGRANVRIADYEDFIQTDAAINPGNSGGPLINIRGELVGINTAIFSTSGGYQGIGFSIPSNMVRSVMDSLREHGKVIRGWLGVSIQTVDKTLADQFGLKEEHGAIVADVVEGSPAAEAGLMRGDIVVEYEGKKVDDSTGLRNMVAATTPDTTAEVVVMREGSRKKIKVRIGELKGEMAGIGGSFDNALADVGVQDLTGDIRSSLGVPRRVEGVVVSDPGGADLRRGDVIVEVNRTAVESVDKYRKVVSKIPAGQDILLLLYRDGGVFYKSLKGK